MNLVPLLIFFYLKSLFILIFISIFGGLCWIWIIKLKEYIHLELIQIK